MMTEWSSVTVRYCTDSSVCPASESGLTPLSTLAWVSSEWRSTSHLWPAWLPSPWSHVSTGACFGTSTGTECPFVYPLWMEVCTCIYSVLSLCVAERHGLKEPAKMEELQMKIIDCLRDHCTYNSEAQKKPQFFSRILGKIPELRTLCREGLQRLYCLKLQNMCSPPPVIESLFITSQLPF